MMRKKTCEGWRVRVVVAEVFFSSVTPSEAFQNDADFLEIWLRPRERLARSSRQFATDRKKMKDQEDEHFV